MGDGGCFHDALQYIYQEYDGDFQFKHGNTIWLFVKVQKLISHN